MYNSLENCEWDDFRISTVNVSFWRDFFVIFLEKSAIRRVIIVYKIID